MCISDGVLRAKLDGELNDAEVRELNAHMEQCPKCRERAEAVAASAGRVRELVSNLGAQQPEVDTAAAFARLERRAGDPVRPRARWMTARFVPAWGAALAATLVLVVFASAPGRAFAQKMLGMLRMNAVVAVPIEQNVTDVGKQQTLRQVLADSVTTTIESRRVTAANRADANRLAGYDILLPALRQDTPQLTVNTRHAFNFTAKQERLQTLVSALGRTDLDIPPQLDGAKVFVDIQPAAEARYGNCPSGRGWREMPPADIENCLTVVQAPSPSVVTLPELNLNAIAEFGLQLAGMSAQEAHTFSQTVDWTTTMAIPIPRDAASYRTVDINGAQGILITGSTGHNVQVQGKRVTLPPGYALLWARNGMIYSLSGFGNPSQAPSIAESLR